LSYTDAGTVVSSNFGPQTYQLRVTAQVTGYGEIDNLGTVITTATRDSVGFDIYTGQSSAALSEQRLLLISRRLTFALMASSGGVDEATHPIQAPRLTWATLQLGRKARRGSFHLQSCGATMTAKISFGHRVKGSVRNLKNVVQIKKCFQELRATPHGCLGSKELKHALNYAYGNRCRGSNSYYVAGSSRQRGSHL
jgi:hypothetical protein